MTKTYKLGHTGSVELIRTCLVQMDLRHVALDNSCIDFSRIFKGRMDVVKVLSRVTLHSAAGPALLVDFSNDALLVAGLALLPDYKFVALTAKRWLLRKISDAEGGQPDAPA